MSRLMLCLCILLQAGLCEAAQIFAGPDALPRIGSGLESVSSQWRSPCVDGTVQPSAANRSITMKMYDSQSASEILEDQRGYGSLKVDFWVLGAKARSEFFLRNSESRTQSSLMWSVEYRGGSVFLNKRQLNPRGLDALKRPKTEQRRICGDQFIIGAALGAKFYLAASLVFDSEVKYRYFKTKVSASAFGGLLKKDKSSTDEVRSTAQNAWLSIQAFQYGGDSFDLDLLSASHVSYCPMDNLEPCLERFSALHRYAFGADGFRKQADSSRTEQLAVLWLNASSYPDAGHYLGEETAPEAMDHGFVDLSEHLFEWNSAVQQSISQVNTRLLEIGRNGAGRDDAQRQLAALESKAEAIRKAARLCSDQTRYEACKSRIDSINTMGSSP